MSTGQIAAPGCVLCGCWAISGCLPNNRSGAMWARIEMGALLVLLIVALVIVVVTR